MHNAIFFTILITFTFNKIVSQELGWNLHHKNGVNQGSEKESLGHIHFVDDLNGWAVGDRGLIKNTTDGGKTWKTRVSPTNKSISKSFFIDAHTGWIVGAQGLLFKTSDGGTTWNDLSIVGSMSFVRDIYFMDKNKGWIVHENEVYKSNDGGATWESLDLPNSSDNDRYFLQIVFRDKKTGWLVHSEGLFQTLDGGLTWQENKVLDLSKYNYGFLSTLNLHSGNNMALVLNQPDYILFSSDGGNTWKKRVGPMENPENGDAIFHYSIVSTPDNTLLFYGSQGWRDSKIFKSGNQGESWQELKMPLQNAVRSLHFVNDKIGFVVGNEGLLKTEDGGKSWIVQSERPLPSINDVYFTSPSTGFAVGHESTILMTTDGGASWQKSAVDVPNLMLTSLTLLSTTHSWITGSQGAVLRMEENGARWSHKSYSEDIQFNSDAEREMLKNTFPDGKNHFVIHKIVNFNLKELWMFAREPYGLGVSHIFRSIDGGDNWAKVPPAQEYNFVDFIMSNRVQFYAIDRKNLYVSNDACLTWHQIPLPKSTWFNLWQIQRVPNFGYVIQTDRSLLFYNPSQNSISEKPFKNNLKIKATYFRNAELGWGITDNRVYETTDGGDTWYPITAEGAIRVKLNSLTFFGDNSLWVYGENGFIAHLEKDVPPSNPEQEFKDEIKNRLNNFINRSRD